MLKHAIVILCLFAVMPSVFGGIGAGNGFRHLSREEFDFHMAYPSDWSYVSAVNTNAPGCTGGVQCSEWRMENSNLISDPAELSWAHAVFMLSVPVQNINELEDWAKVTFQGVTNWSRPQGEPFVMIRSDDMPDGPGAWKRIELYLTQAMQVVAVTTRSHRNWRNSIEAILGSIDRDAANPEIIKIEMETQNPRVGEEACIRIEVNDLRNAFEDKGLDVIFTGHPSHYSLKTRIEWVAEHNWFLACTQVTTHFDVDGLFPDQMTISAGDDRETECKRSGQSYVCKVCSEPSPAGVSHCKWLPAGFSVDVAPLTVGHVDREGPLFESISFDEQTLQLTIAASDHTGFGLGEVITDRGFKVLVPPPSGPSLRQVVDLSPVIFSGWNTVNAIVLYDTNGEGAMLLNKGGHTYEYFDMDNRKVTTTFPVINFFAVLGGN